MVQYFRLRYSLRSLALGLAVIALPCALVAHLIAQIRSENASAHLLQAAIVQTARTTSRSDLRINPRHPPWESWRRALYYAAGSPGSVHWLRIVNDGEARVLAEHGSALHHLRSVEVVPRSYNDDRGLITCEQIRAVSKLGPLERLVLSGNFAPDAEIAQLARIPKIDRLNLEADEFPAHVIEQLASVNATSIHILSGEYTFQFPSEAFASFRRSRCASLEIWGGVDDRALELIAMAPNLESLSIICTPPSQSGPQITDEGVRLASKHFRLYDLKLEMCEISDESLDSIAAIKSLKTVNLTPWKEFTPERLDRLRKMRPDLRVN